MNALDDLTMLVPTGLQVPCWFWMAKLTADFPNLTYRPWFLGAHADAGHVVCRLAAVAAYVIALGGAAYSFASVLLGEPAGNQFGVVLRSWAGPVIGFHMVGVMAKKLLREKTRG